MVLTHRFSPVSNDDLWRTMLPPAGTALLDKEMPLSYVRDLYVPDRSEENLVRLLTRQLARPTDRSPEEIRRFFTELKKYPALREQTGRSLFYRVFGFSVAIDVLKMQRLSGIILGASTEAPGISSQDLIYVYGGLLESAYLVAWSLTTSAEVQTAVNGDMTTLLRYRSLWHQLPQRVRAGHL